MVSDIDIDNTISYLSKINEFFNVYWLGPYTESRLNFTSIKSYENLNFKINAQTTDSNNLEPHFNSFIFYLG